MKVSSRTRVLLIKLLKCIKVPFLTTSSLLILACVDNEKVNVTNELNFLMHNN